MFYWKQKTESGTTLEDELLSCKAVSRVLIASAFLSREGVRILQQIKSKYSLQRENITLYLSSQFSADKPHEILELLSGVCVTKILFDQNFHPKVYYLEGKPAKAIYGSSNFTEGGMTNNIEFDSIGAPPADEAAQIKAFFDYCDRRAKAVDAEVIQYYKDKQEEIADLRRTQRKLTSTLTGFTHQEDVFSQDDYDLGGYYFDFDDYETFFKRNRKKSDSVIKARREAVQRKMLAINSLIYPQIKKLGIEHHRSDKHITSLIIPHPVNQMSVGWLGVRYGKTPREVDELNFAKERDDDGYGFQKHGCIQYSIGSNGFDINLFLAVRHDAVDRYHLHQHLSEYRSKIEEELAKLKGNDMTWMIWNHEDEEPISFDVDNDDPSDFFDFFRENDRDGRESYLQKDYAPDDPVLQTKESIGTEVVRVTKILLPLYNKIVWRP